MKYPWIPMALLLIVASSSAQIAADIVIVNGKVVTLDNYNTVAQALAIAGNRIISVGDNSAIVKLKGSKTQVIDAAGKTVIPGLFDSHLHVIRAGRSYNAELRWDGVSTLSRALQMLKEQAARTPKGQWVRVIGGWNEYQFKERRLPTKEEIEQATGNTPAFILYLYGKAWLNKAALETLGINGDTPNPPGGLIEKDIHGQTTGLLIAEPNAFLLYATLAKLPELSDAEKINSTIHYMRELNRLGVTAVMDAGGGFQNYPDDYGITDSLYNLGKLTVRLPYFLFAQKKGAELADYTRWTGLVSIGPHDNDQITMEYHVSGGGENLVADAADFENFLFPRPELPMTMEKNLEGVIDLLVRKRWPFRLHATYDESISRDLDVIESVNKRTPLNGLVWFIDHAETISEHNLNRVKALNGGIAIQHRMAYQGEAFVRRYGKKEAEMAPPVKKMLNAGIPVGLGTDGTRVASYNPWIALYWITTGRTIGNTRIMSEEAVLDRITALKLFTKGGYSLLGIDNIGGSLRKGYLADVVILNKDYFSIQDEEIKSVSAVITIVDGKVVFGADHHSSLAPYLPPVEPEWSPVKYYGGYQSY